MKLKLNKNEVPGKQKMKFEANKNEVSFKQKWSSRYTEMKF